MMSTATASSKRRTNNENHSLGGPRPAITRPGHACSHCGGSGREPGILEIDFSRAGERRGELQKLAEQSGVDVSTLSRMFGGQKVPSLPTVILVANALGITESQLIRHPVIWHRAIQQIEQPN